MASLEQFEELKTLIMGVDKKETVFSEQLTKVERSLTSMIHEVKADVNVLNVKFETSQKEITTLRHDFTELERGVQGMDLQLQDLKNDKLVKQKIEFQQQIDELKEKAILLEKHDRKYNILIYGIDDSNPEENVYATTRKLFNEKLLRDAQQGNSMPLANAHRVATHGKGPKSILVRFLHFGD
ncbi:RPGRIP1L [Mytilus coruscus]|uniref:RPGRIP1L n=1 Tax=Mytilus coruscus TaxID=42192 RepID=A0A6J8C9T0_MYTCO|nr:RPGRIP1L [Mytilus coruscus]